MKTSVALEATFKRSSTGARLWSALSLGVACLWLAGCSSLESLPRDQHGATERIRAERVLVVGTSSGTSSNAAASVTERAERRLVQRVAARLGARVQWRRGNAHTLLEALQELKLPLVAASLPCDSPFAEAVGFSKPYLEDGPQHKDYCLAVAPGENRLLLLIDQTIAEEKKKQDQSEAKGGDK